MGETGWVFIEMELSPAQVKKATTKRHPPDVRAVVLSKLEREAMRVGE